MPLPGVIYDITDIYGTTATPAGSAKIGSRPDQGMSIIDDKLNKVYVFVKNIVAATQTAGNAGNYDIATNGKSFEVGKPATATLDTLAGVFLAAPVQNGFGWIQVYGENTGILVEGTVAIAAGDSLKGTNAQFYLVKDTAAGTTPTYHRYGRLYAAYSTASAAKKAGFLYCLG